MHSDQTQLSKQCCANYRLAAENSAILSDAFIVANGSTEAVFDAAIGNISSGVHADAQRIASQLRRAFRYDSTTWGIADTSDSSLSGLSTVAGLEALTSGSADVSRAVIIS